MQDLVAILIVAAAAAFLARRAWITMARKTAGKCGGCANCPTSSSTPTNLVTISPIPPDGKV